MLFFFAIHDKRCVELPFIQMLTCALFVWCSRWSTLRDFWWFMFLWDLTTLFWPCGCCRGLHHLQIFFFFCEIQEGKPSDGWRLDWCVCRKSVNNINFIWINKKVGSGKSHMAFFFSQVILSSTDKLFSNQSFELMTQSHLTVRAALCLIFLHEMRSVKDVPSNLSFWRFWETLFRLRAELWNAGSRAGLPTP